MQYKINANSLMAPSVNVVMRLTADAQGNYSDNGRARVSFPAVVGRSYKKQGDEEWTEVSQFFYVTLFGEAAERQMGLSKATLVLVEFHLSDLKGRLMMKDGVPMTNQDGSSRVSLDIIARSIRKVAEPAGAGEPQAEAEEWG